MGTTHVTHEKPAVFVPAPPPHLAIFTAIAAGVAAFGVVVLVVLEALR